MPTVQPTTELARRAGQQHQQQPSELATLRTLVDRLAGEGDVRGTLAEFLRGGARLLGARRAFLTLGPGPALDVALEGPVTLGLRHADCGAIETIPKAASGAAAVLAGAEQVLHADIAADDSLDARYREVAAQLSVGAALSVRVPDGDGTLAAATWLYDGSAGPTRRQQQLARRYCRLAGRLLASAIAYERVRRAALALRHELLPGRLPLVPGLELAARYRPGPRTLDLPGYWHETVPLHDGGVGIAVGNVTDSGPHAAAVVSRLRTALRAYAVVEGEDPVAVLGDLDLLVQATEPVEPATAVYAHLDPVGWRIAVAAAAHCPPLLVTGFGANLVETSVSAPLGMLSRWEAPGVELGASPDDLLVLYSEGLVCGPDEEPDAGLDRLRELAGAAPNEAREDANRFCDYLEQRSLEQRSVEQSCPAHPGAEGSAPDRAERGYTLVVARFRAPAEP